VNLDREGLRRVRRELRSILIVYLLGALVVAVVAQRCVSG
jgi:hypothetical protein